MDNRILEILLELKEELAELKADVRQLKESQPDVKLLVEQHKRRAWLGASSFRTLTIITTLLTTYLTVAKVLGH